ncbi:hypothetical protein LOTGIDRAFT_154920 [Lottia gigantea]|uniref:OPA3-like protein n=1 Tax=Lottia gigantea TaxID=225164 RepID=V3ZMA3_LOTGI|nr:hypothetical protein LOTGIDRAFT_154920 [Lottia gigantea]ESO85427.1 hypothetical protein LOTGIDRAFT_154920 [Lottia gigantea]
MVFPLVQLAYLGVKRSSKFLANRLKRRAKKSLFFRNYICMPTAQLYHSFEVKVRLKLLGLGKANHIEKLTETMAVELGAELLGEFIIYSVAAMIIYIEYSRSGSREEAKEQAMIQKDLILERRLQEQGLLIEKLHAEVREMQRFIGDLDTRNKSLSSRLFGKS